MAEYLVDSRSEVELRVAVNRQSECPAVEQLVDSDSGAELQMAEYLRPKCLAAKSVVDSGASREFRHQAEYSMWRVNSAKSPYLEVSFHQNGHLVLPGELVEKLDAVLSSGPHTGHKCRPVGDFL